MNEVVIYKSGEVVGHQANQAMQKIAAMVLDTVGARSKRDYGRALDNFLTWHTTTGQTGLNKATVNAHIAYLKAQGRTGQQYQPTVGCYSQVGERSCRQPMVAWIKALIDNWTASAGIQSGLLLRRTLKGGHLQESGMTSQSVWNVLPPTHRSPTLPA